MNPEDPKYTPLEKALAWAKETQYGPGHQFNWAKVAAALGAKNGYVPMTAEEVEALWKKHGNIKSKRWTLIMNNIGSGKEEVVKLYEKEMARYNSKLSMQGHYTVVEWFNMHKTKPIICKFEDYEELTIYDFATRCPNWWLEGPGEPTQLWRLEENGDYTFVNKIGVEQKVEVVTKSSKPVVKEEKPVEKPKPEPEKKVVLSTSCNIFEWFINGWIRFFRSVFGL